MRLRLASRMSCAADAPQDRIVLQSKSIASDISLIPLIYLYRDLDPLPSTLVLASKIEHP